MMKVLSLTTVLLLAVPLGAQPADSGAASRPADQKDFAAAVETAHGGEALEGKEVIQCELRVVFGGKTRFDGTFTFTPSMSHVRMEPKEGPGAVYDGEEVYALPAEGAGDTSGHRFAIFTWPYFVLVPFKLDDPGTKLEDKGVQSSGGKEYETARLTFEGEVGDTPKDWYLVYRDPETDRVAALAYIVTYGKDAEAAEKSTPNGVLYDRHETVNGVTLPTHMTFLRWNEKDAHHGDPIGEATLSNVRFVPFDAAQFKAVEGAKPLPLPGIEK